MARPVPVLPDVGSTMVPPGLSLPSRSAASMSATATRSLIEPPGLSDSTLATSCGVRPAPRRDRRTSGVSPMASRIESLMSTVDAVVVALMLPQCGIHAAFSLGGRRSFGINRDQPPILRLRSATMAAVPNDGLDDVDRRLLELLAADARISNARLAARRRRRALDRPRAGPRAARAAASSAASTPRSTSPPSGARCRRSSPSASSVHSREQIESFTEHVRTLPGVLSIFHVTGQTDYLLWVAAADAQDLREFVVEHLASDPAVAHAETSLIYEQRRGPGVFGADPA